MRYLILAFLVSCSVVEVNVVEYEGHDVEMELVPMVLEFERRCKIPVKTNLKFAYLPGNAVGLCSILYFGQIYIDYTWWKNEWNYWRREEVVFHEIGHCILGRTHDNSLNKLGMENSIMSDTVFESYYQYEIYREEYINELCGED